MDKDIKEIPKNVSAVSDICLNDFSNTILNFYQELPDLERMAIDTVCNEVKHESSTNMQLVMRYHMLLRNKALTNGSKHDMIHSATQNRKDAEVCRNE